MRKITYLTKLFDTKRSRDLPRYDGRSKGGLWRTKVTNFLVTRCPEILILLQYVEKRIEEIKLDDIVRGFPECGGQETRVLCHHLGVPQREPGG